MFHRMFRFSALLACTLAFSTLARADLLDDIRQAKKIRVAIELALPPYGIMSDKMEPSGSDVETAQLLAKDLGVSLEIVPATAPSRIPFLQTNKADLIISTLSISPERAKVVDFSIPYSVIDSVVAAPKSMHITGYPDLAGKTVAITRGNAQEAELSQKAVGAKIVRYDDDASLVVAAVSGQATIVSTATTLLKAIQLKSPSREMETKFVIQVYQLGIAMRKDEPRLHTWINDWVKTNRENGKLNAIFKKYHGRDLPPIPQ